MLHNHTEASVHNKEVCILYTQSAPDNVATLSSCHMPCVRKFIASRSAVKDLYTVCIAIIKPPKKWKLFLSFLTSVSPPCMQVSALGEKFVLNIKFNNYLSIGAWLESVIWGREVVLRSQPLIPAGKGLVTCNTWSCSTGMQKLAILRDVTLQFILRSVCLPIISTSTQCLMTTRDICTHALP